MRNRPFLKKLLPLSLGLTCLFSAVAYAAEEPSPAYDEKKMSETFGHIIIKHLRQLDVPFDLDSIKQGMLDEINGKPAPLSEQEYEERIAQIQDAQWQKAVAKNLTQAEEFLSGLKKKEGYVELEDGKLFYQIVKEGQGTSVAEHGVPLVIYTGSFIDGSVFSSSQEKPIAIPVDQAIRGFKLGMSGMKEGEKRRLYIHPDLAYGTSGALPPNSLLIFDIEVVKASSNVQLQPAPKGASEGQSPSLRSLVE